MHMELYSEHLDTLKTRYSHALEKAGYDQIVISAGSLVVVAEDDRAYPYTPMAFAQQWLPFDLDPNTFIVFRPGEKPRLLWPARADFWHLTPAAPSGDWTRHWRVDAAEDLVDWMPELQGRIAWLGPKHPALDTVGVDVDLNPPALKAELSYYRAWKTDFEIECLAEANRKAVLGHEAARQAFLRGGSEAQIYRDYLAASEQLESQEPYSGIIALNESAATLHYERRSFTAPAEHRTLLIDAGAKVNGYASDITRTHTTDKARFRDLLDSMEQLQRSLNNLVKPGVTMVELQRQALEAIAGLLKVHGICELSVQEQLAKRIPQTFFPHGLGHLLGLQVHDVGGHQQDAEGNQKPDPDAPFLRLTRTLEPGMVITMEPGLYFIPMLINQLIDREPEHGLNLDVVKAFQPFGGIRIEDNLVVTKDGHRNLTREAFGTD